eukprot:scaffold962_cov372-Prasinococcus_capsulatus_cf.AAC.7
MPALRWQPHVAQAVLCYIDREVRGSVPKSWKMDSVVDLEFQMSHSDGLFAQVCIRLTMVVTEASPAVRAWGYGSKMSASCALMDSLDSNTGSCRCS